MKYLSILFLLALASCGGGGGSSPKILNAGAADAAGCTVTPVAGPPPGANVNCGGADVFIPFGTRGEKGDTGNAGSQGVQGVAGQDGNDGADGNNGQNCTFTREDENNRVAIDCGGNVVYVNDGGSGGTGSLASTTTHLLNYRVNTSGTVYSGGVSQAITSIYSPGARFATVTLNDDGNVITEIFRERNGDPTLGVKIYAENHFDDGGLYHSLVRPALVWDNLLSGGSNMTKKIWYKYGTEHRENGLGPSRHETHGSYYSKYWRVNGQLHRVGDFPAIETKSLHGGTTKQYYVNGERSRITGPSYVNTRYACSQDGYTRIWEIEGVIYKAYHHNPCYTNQDYLTYGAFATPAASQQAYIDAGGSSSAWYATE